MWGQGGPRGQSVWLLKGNVLTGRFPAATGSLISSAQARGRGWCRLQRAGSTHSREEMKCPPCSRTMPLISSQIRLSSMRATVRQGQQVHVRPWDEREVAAGCSTRPPNGLWGFSFTLCGIEMIVQGRACICCVHAQLSVSMCIEAQGQRNRAFTVTCCSSPGTVCSPYPGCSHPSCLL